MTLKVAVGRLRIGALIGVLVAATTPGQPVDAQSRTGLRVGYAPALIPVRATASFAPSISASGANHWVRGAIIGGAVGAAIGVFFYDEFESETHGRIYVVTWAFAGAVIGGLIGAHHHRPS